MNYYLPAASKAVIDDYNEIQKSKYKQYLIITREDLKENYYETVRLAYIGMFHKYENYINDLILHADLFLSDINQEKTSITTYAKQYFNYNIKDWKNSSIISRINWVTNCNKHYDGYPLKLPKHDYYLHIPDTEKIKLTKENFLEDVDYIISNYTLMLQTVFLIAMHKIACGGETYEIDEFTDLDIHQQLLDKRKNLDVHVKNFIEGIKQM